MLDESSEVPGPEVCHTGGDPVSTCPWSSPRVSVDRAEGQGQSPFFPSFPSAPPGLSESSGAARGGDGRLGAGRHLYLLGNIRSQSLHSWACPSAPLPSPSGLSSSARPS